MEVVEEALAAALAETIETVAGDAAEAAERRHAAAVVRARLADLLGHDAPVATLIDELATSIREGAAVDEATVTAVRETVRIKLAVSNPDYATTSD